MPPTQADERTAEKKGVSAVDAVDDPYKMLANNLAVSSSDLELQRFLHQTKAIRRRIRQEVNNADFYGDFLDCLMTIITRTNNRPALNRTLAETSDFFYSCLDLARLRSELRHYCERYGREVD